MRASRAAAMAAAVSAALTLAICRSSSGTSSSGLAGSLARGVAAARSVALLHADDDPPPEDVAHVTFCAEKCRFQKYMCDPVEAEKRLRLGLPAPNCVERSTTVEDDLYWFRKSDPKAKIEATKRRAAARHKATVELIRWAARQARRRRPDDGVAETGAQQPCEEIGFANEHPMMFPEEFEIVVKTMAHAQPETYLEWGSGMSTSFYPLLASGRVAVIDGYPPWCKRVQQDPTVSCMVREGRLTFACKEPLRPDGSSIPVLGEGRLPNDISEDDVRTIAQSYVNAVEETGMTHFDAALVDGRFRVACALKLLTYLGPKSVLFMHDFWMRQRYHVVLNYYDVIGYARSLVVLRKKAVLPNGFETAYLKHMEKKHML